MHHPCEGRHSRHHPGFGWFRGRDRHGPEAEFAPGPRGRGGRGGFGPDGFGPQEPGFRGPGFGGPGGGWGGGPRAGRVLGHGDLPLLLLALIAQTPRHGYDLIRAIEDKFGGAYAPSPGAVYPTLTLLEEQDYIRSEAAGGSKKLYAITPEGEAHLAANAAVVQGILARADIAAQVYSSRVMPDVVMEAVRTLRQALHMRRGPWTGAEAERVRGVLEAAARQIAGGEPS